MERFENMSPNENQLRSPSLSDIHDYRKQAIPHRYRSSVLEASPVTVPLLATGACSPAVLVTEPYRLPAAALSASQLAGYPQVERLMFHDFHEFSPKSSQRL